MSTKCRCLQRSSGWPERRTRLDTGGRGFESRRCNAGGFHVLCDEAIVRKAGTARNRLAHILQKGAYVWTELRVLPRWPTAL